jgi:hypothetical protein
MSLLYVGTTSLTVIGGATGRAYHFSHSGCRLTVDARDLPGMAGIPSLRRGG